MLPSDTHWALVGFQRSAYNSADLVAFTVNVKVASKRSFAAFTGQVGEGNAEPPTRPSANARYPQVEEWHARLGDLVPAPPHATDLDPWGTVERGTDLQVLAGDVLSAFTDFALPEMLRRVRGEVTLEPSLPVLDEALE